MLRFIPLLLSASLALAQQYTISTVAGGAPPTTPHEEPPSMPPVVAPAPSAVRPLLARAALVLALTLVLALSARVVAESAS